MTRRYVPASHAGVERAQELRREPFPFERPEPQERAAWEAEPETPPEPRPKPGRPKVVFRNLPDNMVPVRVEELDVLIDAADESLRRDRPDPLARLRRSGHVQQYRRSQEQGKRAQF